MVGAEISLTLPGLGAKVGGDGEKRLGVGLSGPMVFERGLQFTLGADAGEAESGDSDGHGSLYRLMARADRCAQTTARSSLRDGVHATRPDTPPGDVMCRGRSPGSRVTAAVRPSQG